MKKAPLEDLKDFLDYNNPETLYHYTNLSAFQSIIENSELWMSNMYYLNDKDEFELGMRIVIEELENYKRGFEILDSTKYYISALEKAVEFIKAKDSPYILSLTENNDLLSQWRGYTNNGIGVNIGLNKTFFKDASFGVFKCIYDSKKQRDIIRHIITESIFMFVGISHSQGKFKGKLYDNKDLDEAITIAGRYFIDRIVIACSLIKDSSFKEEDEWRILFVKNDKKIHFINRGNYLKPIIKQELKNLDKIIDAIILGPNPESELCCQSIKKFCEVNNINSSKVYTSKIPYRN